MLKSFLLQPQILETLGRAGHGSKILIADGNYPFGSKLGPHARLVSMNLCPGVATCTQILSAICSATPIEAAHVMETYKTGPYAMKEDPPIWAEFRTLLKDHGYTGDLVQMERQSFYTAAGSPDVILTVASADQRIYANLLLTVGVVMPK